MKIYGSLYVGSTSLPFHNRVAQHLQVNRAGKLQSVIHIHASSQHHRPAREVFDFKIISRHPTEIRCRIAEALAIKNLSPSLNTKDEFIGYSLFFI